jgi:light-regulated signal transduction histidine kinase (bacteriophytochrome)
MIDAPYDRPQMFEAFIKASQYIVRLTSQQDVWENLGKLVTAYFPAGWTAFAHRNSSGEYSLDNCSLPDSDCSRLILTDEVRTTIEDVLDSGFLATKVLKFPLPSLVVFLPIAGKTPPKKVMFIGHENVAALPKELLNIYLAIAGLASATFDRIESERALANYSAHLEKSVKDATAELTRSNQDLEQFAYVASHDLQEPLRAVTGFLGLLKQDFQSDLNACANEYIAFAVEGAERMSQLIKDLLAFSRVDRQGKTPKVIDLKEALEIVLANLHTSLCEVNATITHDELPFVMGDFTHMIQIFQNFIGNALKFRHHERSCAIHVGAHRSENWWTLSVNDNGIGIAQEHFERIFAVFQRLHTRNKYPGTGIGLAICKKIIERQGGSVWVESKPNEGSTFFFTLPAVENGSGADLNTV